jgi:hypothetical protein
MDLKLGGRYKMGKKLGSGAFGECYLGKLSKFDFSLQASVISAKIDSNHYLFSKGLKNRRRSCFENCKLLSNFYFIYQISNFIVQESNRT